MTVEFGNNPPLEQEPEPEFIDDIAAWYEQHKDQEVTLIGAVEKTMREAEEDGYLHVGQDVMDSIEYKKGQAIVGNPGEDEYPFGDLKESPAVSMQRFLDSHVKTEKGTYIKKPFKAIPVSKEIKFLASNGEEMTVKPGGYVAQGLYSIADTSAKSYQEVHED